MREREGGSEERERGRGKGGGERGGTIMFREFEKKKEPF